MQKTDQSWEGQLGEYTLSVSLRYYQKPNGYVSAEVCKTLRYPGFRRQKWTDFGFTRQQPPVWQAEQHFDAYVKEALRLGFKTQAPAGKPVKIRRKWIEKYETTVRPRTLQDVWRDELKNTYAGMEVIEGMSEAL